MKNICFDSEKQNNALPIVLVRTLLKIAVYRRKTFMHKVNKLLAIFIYNLKLSLTTMKNHSNIGNSLIFYSVLSQLHLRHTGKFCSCDFDRKIKRHFEHTRILVPKMNFEQNIEKVLFTSQIILLNFSRLQIGSLSEMLSLGSGKVRLDLHSMQRRKVRSIQLNFFFF
jgi:hypothetical protein